MLAALNSNRLFLGLLVFAASLACPHPSPGEDVQAKDRAANRRSRLDQRALFKRQARLRAIEKRLTGGAPRSSEEDWYVIQFFDRAIRATPPQVEFGIWRPHGTLEAVQVRKCLEVQGRRAAAEAIENHLGDGPEALDQLSDSAFRNETSWSKLWTFRSFRSKIEADEFYDFVAPPRKPADASGR
jgi:hypothetical protein